jgi:hypothetical protein
MPTKRTLSNTNTNTNTNNSTKEEEIPKKDLIKKKEKKSGPTKPKNGKCSSHRRVPDCNKPGSGCHWVRGRGCMEGESTSVVAEPRRRLEDNDDDIALVEAERGEATTKNKKTDQKSSVVSERKKKNAKLLKKLTDKSVPIKKPTRVKTAEENNINNENQTNTKTNTKNNDNVVLKTAGEVLENQTKITKTKEVKTTNTTTNNNEKKVSSPKEKENTNKEDTKVQAQQQYTRDPKTTRDLWTKLVESAPFTKFAVNPVTSKPFTDQEIYDVLAAVAKGQTRTLGSLVAKKTTFPVFQAGLSGLKVTNMYLVMYDYDKDSGAFNRDKHLRVFKLGALPDFRLSTPFPSSSSDLPKAITTTQESLIAWIRRKAADGTIFSDPSANEFHPAVRIMMDGFKSVIGLTQAAIDGKAREVCVAAGLISAV